MQTQKGITLVELLVTVLIVAIIAAIVIPSWLSFLQDYRTRSARDNAYQVLLNAKSTARHTKETHEACFREHQGNIEYSVHHRRWGGTCTNANWQSLGIPQVKIDAANTSFYHRNNIYRVQFNYLGVTNGRLGRITFRSGKHRYCTYLSTLLGAQRKQKGQNCNR
ncbi:prepilin-type N-terminal cleavage/methylation domain-containing protein [Laspinema sp. A4]|uniref:pilus assembly FimT family protein n=1 Tax=Laspinema sp. D2d TaxID=2953686 RepID=UPI0021BA8ABA|nr:prepilin-type N-terminal cleavage/methylation domain-containing protein [Laspinema sp. D2d]MCT7984963.1 prepilin-type N-terminal cleavage/methylation domain-containing protein [Laspinema sp. D2d]